MEKINIYNISICSFGNVLSGGEKFTYEVIPRLSKKYSSVNFFCYSSLSEKWNNSNNKTINLFKNNLKAKSKVSILLLYFVIFIKCLKFIKRFDTKNNSIISHSDAWPDTLMAYLLKVKNKDARWLAITHMVLPNLFQGYKYIYTNKYKLPNIIEIYQWLNQKLFFLLQKKADLLLSINSNDKNYLLRNNKNVAIIKYGKEYSGEPNINSESKIYDVCFLGRFYKQKGIVEIPDILQRLKNIYDKKLSIIFIGNKNNYADWLEKRLKSENLDYNIEFLGPKYGDEKYDLLKKSKTMIFPSHFESFGIVYLDAISVGTPVVEYNLPCFSDHKYGVIKVPFKNNIAFAEELKKILTDNFLYKKLSNEGFEYSKEFSWDKTIESFEKYL